MIFVERVDHHLKQRLRIRFIILKDEVYPSFLAALTVAVVISFFLEVEGTTIRASLIHRLKTE